MGRDADELGWHDLTQLYSRHLPHFAGTDRFLPWHRYLLWVMEVLLQENGECDLSIPYFDWTLDVGDMGGAAAWQANYFGGDGNQETHCVLYHPFRSSGFSSWSPCLMRRFNNSIWLPDAVSVAHILNNGNYTLLRLQLEAMSGLFQLFLGGHSLTPERFYDPVFLSHVAYLDKIFDDWLRKHGRSDSFFPPEMRPVLMEPFGVTPDDALDSILQHGVSYLLPSKGAPCLKDDVQMLDQSSKSDQEDALGYSSTMLESIDTLHEEDGYDDRGYTAEGFDSLGYDRRGYNKDSFNRDGYNLAGFDRLGFDRYGFKEDGCMSLGPPFCRLTLNNTNEKSLLFDTYGYTKEGFNILGLDRNGFDAFGFDTEGYDRRKCNYQSRGPFYMLTKARVEEELEGVSDDSKLMNIERMCPEVTQVPDWWLTHNYFSQVFLEYVIL